MPEYSLPRDHLPHCSGIYGAPPPSRPPLGAPSRQGRSIESSACCVVLARLKANPRPAARSSFPALPEFGYDITAMQHAFYKDPLGQPGCLVTLTCPAAKDPALRAAHPTSSNMILLTEGLPEWFREAGAGEDSGKASRRSPEYKDRKARFEELFLERMYQYYPLTRGRVASCVLSTPLTAEHFLAAPGGASYGLDWGPAHFDFDLHESYLHPQTKIPGLMLTGEAVCFGGFYGALSTAYATAAHALGLPGLMGVLLRSRQVPPVMDKGE
mmetsp:Transcript_33263/g.106075  ORF Transcript_33263/g.106075 Transcript_33263/m.106075 type:complete len:270 (+) Transcript_33263:1284-2093(+)